MNHVSPSFANAAAGRLPGITAIGACFILQSIYERFFCGGGYFGFWPITVFLLLPAIAFLISSNPAPSVGAAVVIILFSLWANRSECGPYVGGGAAMAYVVVFLFGLPASIIVGLLGGFIWAKHAHKEENEP